MKDEFDLAVSVFLTNYLDLKEQARAEMHTLYNEADYPSLAACGVDALRLSPRSEGMRQVIGEFAAVRDGALPPLAVSGCNGYWHGRPGMLTVEGVGL